MTDWVIFSIIMLIIIVSGIFAIRQLKRSKRTGEKESVFSLILEFLDSVIHIH